MCISVILNGQFYLLMCHICLKYIAVIQQTLAKTSNDINKCLLSNDQIIEIYVYISIYILTYI